MGQGSGVGLPRASMGIPKHKLLQAGAGLSRSGPHAWDRGARSRPSVCVDAFLLGRLCTRVWWGLATGGTGEHSSKSGRVELRHQLTGEQPRS